MVTGVSRRSVPGSLLLFVYILPLGCILYISYHWAVFCIYLTTGLYFVYILPLGCILYISYHWAVFCIYLTTGLYFVYILPLGCILYISYHWAVFCIYLTTGLYFVYILPLGCILTIHGVSYHIYADDTQGFVNFPVQDSDVQQGSLHTD